MDTHRHSPNFNDYIQNAALGAVAGLQYAALREMQARSIAEATERDMRFWREVAQDRNPQVTNRIEIEDIATSLMSFDRTETAAQAKRDMGQHLPGQTSSFPRLVWAAVIIAVMLMGVFFIAFFGPGSNGDCFREYHELKDTNPERAEQIYNVCDQRAKSGLTKPGLVWDRAQPFGWIWVGSGVAVATWVLAGIGRPTAPSYHPQDDSIICQMAYPGRRLKTKHGGSFRVSYEETPEYHPQRLRFDVPSTNGQWYSSDVILWDGEPNQTMTRRT